MMAKQTKLKLSDQEYHTDYVTRWKKKHKQKGLCRYCNQDIVAGKTMCQYHLDYFKFYKIFGAKKNRTRIVQS